MQERPRSTQSAPLDPVALQDRSSGAGQAMGALQPSDLVAKAC